MPRELTTYPLSSGYLSKLHACGFLVDDDVKELSPSELGKEMQISPSDALDILDLLRTSTQLPQENEKSAFDLLQEEEANTPIVTFCAALDNLIGGGIPIGCITEICGAPGTGKTQFGIQLVVDAQIPEIFGGVEGEALYIDTEGSFIVERVIEIAESASRHIRQVGQSDPEQTVDCEKFSVENILNGIHVIRCHDYIQLVALSHIIDDFVADHPQVKIIVLDSIAFHFRHDVEDMSLRTRLLHGLVQSFMKVAHDHKIAVVFMNQMTTKILSRNHSTLVPALGQSWGHACTIRIVLEKRDQQRYARLIKSPNRQEGCVSYAVTQDGIRDVAQEERPTDAQRTPNGVERLEGEKQPKRTKVN